MNVGFRSNHFCFFDFFLNMESTQGLETIKTDNHKVPSFFLSSGFCDSSHFNDTVYPRANLHFWQKFGNIVKQGLIDVM